MNLLENDDINLSDLMSHYLKQAGNETLNVLRIKRFYSDEDSFDKLMNRIIEKDANRFDRLLKKDPLPNPWRVFYVILDIVFYEGKEVSPFDTLTRMFQSKTVEYMGWTFSMVHGETTILTVYNRDNELVYRF